MKFLWNDYIFHSDRDSIQSDGGLVAVFAGCEPEGLETD